MRFALPLIPLLAVLASLSPGPAPAVAEEETSAGALMSRFLANCLSQIHDPNAAIDLALDDPSLQPAVDGAADELLSDGDGIAWVDSSSVPGVILAISTSTYHCAVASDGVPAGEAWVQFAALILKLEENQGQEAELRESNIPGGFEGNLIQSFAAFRRGDGHVTTIDLVRPADAEARGLIRLAATITLP